MGLKSVTEIVYHFVDINIEFKQIWSSFSMLNVF